MRYALPLAVGLLLLAAPASAQISLGQEDDFQDGTREGWQNGAVGSAITNIPNGGPNGAGDRFLQVVADGSGPAGRLVVFNDAQWRGDYVAAGVTEIEADLQNLGQTDLDVRVWLEGAGGRFVSTDPVSLAPGSGWRAATFSVEPGALTFAGQGPNDVDATLSNVTRLRIYHATVPIAPGPFIVGTLGIDNVTAGPAGGGGELDLEAENTTPLTVSAGGSVGFSYTIENSTDAPATGDLWYTASPGGVSGVILSGTLPAGQTLSGSFTQAIPPSAPAGTYTYTLNIGVFPGSVVDSETFTLVITSPLRAGEGPAGWAVSRVTPWTLATAATSRSVSAPEAFGLSGAWPNPFRASTTLSLDVPAAGPVSVTAYDLLGRRVAVLMEGEVEAGTHAVAFEPAGLPSGVYVVSARSAHGTSTRRVTLLR